MSHGPHPGSIMPMVNRLNVMAVFVRDIWRYPLTFFLRSASNCSISSMSALLRLQSHAGAASAICSGLRAPAIAAVTSRRRRTQLMASWAQVLR